MRMTALWSALVAATLMAAPTFALAKKPAKTATPNCVKGKVLTALQVRMLQTELVVGALSCGTTPRYNDFVMAYRPDLMNAQKTLMRFFAHESKLEDYKSKTANEVSQRSLPH